MRVADSYQSLRLRFFMVNVFSAQFREVIYSSKQRQSFKNLAVHVPFLKCSTRERYVSPVPSMFSLWTQCSNSVILFCCRWGQDWDPHWSSMPWFLGNFSELTLSCGEGMLSHHQINQVSQAWCRRSLLAELFVDWLLFCISPGCSDDETMYMYSSVGLFPGEWLLLRTWFFGEMIGGVAKHPLLDTH